MIQVIQLKNLNLNNYYLVDSFAENQKAKEKFILTRSKYSPEVFKKLIQDICDICILCDLGLIHNIVLTQDEIQILSSATTLLPMTRHHGSLVNKIFNYCFALQTQKENLLFDNFFSHCHPNIVYKFLDSILKFYKTYHNGNIYISLWDSYPHFENICKKNDVEVKFY